MQCSSTANRMETTISYLPNTIQVPPFTQLTLDIHESHINLRFTQTTILLCIMYQIDRVEQCCTLIFQFNVQVFLFRKAKKKKNECSLSNIIVSGLATIWKIELDPCGSFQRLIIDATMLSSLDMLCASSQFVRIQCAATVARGVQWTITCGCAKGCSAQRLFAGSQYFPISLSLLLYCSICVLYLSRISAQKGAYVWCVDYRLDCRVLMHVCV